MIVLRVTVLAWAVVSGAGCNLLGPSCTSRKESGLGASLSGTVEAAQTVFHRVPYATDGSQNDLKLTWTGQAQPDAVQLQFYATRAACENFVPAQATGSCAILGRGGWIDGHSATSLTITNGRGNPDVLGTPAEYKLWVVGDPQRSATYTVTATWFFGPDC
jgi:hypothetical protein